MVVVTHVVTLVWTALAAYSVPPGDVSWAAPELVDCNEASSSNLLFSSNTQVLSERLVVDTSGWTIPSNITVAPGTLGQLSLNTMYTGTVDGTHLHEVSLDSYTTNLSAAVGRSFSRSTFSDLILESPKPEYDISIRIKRVQNAPVWLRLRCLQFRINGTYTTNETEGTTGVIQPVTSTSTSSTTSISTSTTLALVSTSTSHPLAAPPPPSPPEEGSREWAGEMVLVGTLLLGLGGVALPMAVSSGVVVRKSRTHRTQTSNLPKNIQGLVIRDKQIDAALPHSMARIRLGNHLVMALRRPCRQDATPFTDPHMAAAAMVLSHANVTPCLGFSEKPAMILFKQPVHGFFSLAKKVRHTDALDMTAQLASGLCHLHRHGIAHGHIDLQHIVLNGTTLQWTAYLTEGPLHPWHATDAALPSPNADVWDLTWIIWQLFNNGERPCEEDNKLAWRKSVHQNAGKFVPQGLIRTKLDITLLMYWPESDDCHRTALEILNACPRHGRTDAD